MELYKFKKIIEYIHKFLWKYNQPLTSIPHYKSSIVSDLFIWRNSTDWVTYFEIFDIKSLFNDKEIQKIDVVELIFFNKSGSLINTIKLEITENKRYTLPITEYIQKKTSDEFGTFCVFHSSNPDVVRGLNSFLAERGYISYQFKQSKIRSYVHGNFDAIARHPNGNLELLGGTSFLNRNYNLQYKLLKNSFYEFIIVNTSNIIQRITFKYISEDGKEIDIYELIIQVRGSNIYKFQPKAFNGRLIIISKLVMARPIVFKLNNHSCDVFHG